MTAPPTDERLDRPATSDTTARALVAAIPDPIFRIGTDGIYRGFKVDSEEDLMTPADEVIGHSVHERLPPHVAEAILEAGRRAVAEQEVQQIEYSMELRAEERDYEGRVVACGPDE
ncbi:MAG TPA: PAS domain-containing protein, partial [Gaiella sp.]|nr:PAS domain-containing protein [Gaiella sp.]